VKEIPWRDRNGAPLDGVEGAGSKAFLSAPDKAGKQWPFAIAWASREDVSGAILARADGLNSDRVSGRMDNVDVYRLIYLTLFGVEIAK
jgi:alkaline phosphatase